MLFNSWTYGLFFVAVFAVHWLLPSGWRRPFLLLASYYFYASAIPQYIVLIVGLTVFNYVMGLWLGRTVGASRRKTLLWLGIAGNLSTLAYFKYMGLITRSLQPLLSPLPLLRPLLTDPLLVNVLLPLGISFFTFEFIHYLAELYKGLPPIRNPIDFALFAAFFPTQIAGPIKRFPDFMKQLRHPLALRDVDIDHGVWLILRGLVKKVLVADVLAPIVAVDFAQPGTLGPATAWFAVFAFATQIYCDFSGYTDIGRGSATLLGYTVPENFLAPYQSANPAEFWHRWHVSLSSWLRDYLYIPLGGSRVPRWRVYLNLMITMALGGLWHGASWHFMVWGIYQGILLCGHRLWSRSVGKTALYQRLLRIPLLDFLTRPFTLVLVCIGWVFFRADTLPGALQMLQSMAAFWRPLQQGTTIGKTSAPSVLLLIAALVVICGWVWTFARANVLGDLRAAAARLGVAGMAGGALAVARPLVYVAAVALLLLWPAHVSPTFIYFRF